MTNPLFDYVPKKWSDGEAMLYADMANSVPELWTKTPEVKAIQKDLHRALFQKSGTSEGRKAALARVKDLLTSEFGMNFDEIFDWESYREGYDWSIYG